MTANRGSWKAAERRIAREIGGERVPVTGRIRGAAPDAEHPWLAVEIKTVKRLSALTRKAMAQAVAAQEFIRKKTGENKMPVAILHEDGTLYDESIVQLKLRDFVVILAELEMARAEKAA